MKLREKTSLSHRLYVKFQSFFLRNKEKKTAQNSTKCQKTTPFLIDTKKRAKIDALLNDLARRDALVNAGKMQFLNFFDVKNYMGTKWKYVEPIIVGITIDVIGKYTDKHDISFRYSEDEFIIIFAKASPEEGQLKCQLMTAEIQRLLFEKTEKNEKLKDIKVKASHIGIRATRLVDAPNPMKALDESFQKNTQQFIDDNFKKHAIEAPHSPNHIQGLYKEISDEDFIKKLHYKFIPVALQNNQFKSKFAIVIDDCPTHYNKHGDPLTDYHNILLSLSKSRAALCDLAALDTAISKLTDFPETSFFISVRYNTLVDNTHFQEYFQKLQKLTPRQKMRLYICVYKIPHDIPLTALQRSTMLIRDNCKTLFAIVPYFKKNNYAKLLNSGFKGVCFVLLGKDALPESFIPSIQKFLDETRIYNFKTLALIGERDNHIITRESLNGFHFIGGSVIGRAITDPDSNSNDD